MITANKLDRTGTVVIRTDVFMMMMMMLFSLMMLNKFSLETNNIHCHQVHT